MEKEGSVLRRQSVLFAWFGVSLFAGPVFVAIISFACYAGAGNTLTVAQVYQAVALFSMLRFPLSFLPQFIAQVTAALVSLKRVQDFLAEAQLEEDEASGSAGNAPAGCVSVTGGSLGWQMREQATTVKVDGGAKVAGNGEDKEAAASQPGQGEQKGSKPGRKARGQKQDNAEPEVPLVYKEVLSNVDFEAPQGKLTIVFGKVGSGKSTLLNAVMNLAFLPGLLPFCSPWPGCEAAASLSSPLPATLAAPSSVAPPSTFTVVACSRICQPREPPVTETHPAGALPAEPEASSSSNCVSARKSCTRFRDTSAAVT